MSVQYVPMPLKSARMNAVIAALDANALPAFIEICTAAYAAVIVTIALLKPSFTEANATITMAGPPRSGVASLAGTNVAVIARIKDGGGNIIVQGLSVGTVGQEINLNSVNISGGQTVTLTSGTISHS